MNKYLISIDGDMICATFLNFKNLQESTAGFGKTENEAIIDLLEKEYRTAYRAAVKPNTGNSGSCGDCECNADYAAELKEKLGVPLEAKP